MAFGGAFICVIACYCFASGSFGSHSETVRIDESKYYPVTDVIDGDTFKAKVDGRIITVRLLGINTPETVDPRKGVECFGPEASAEGKSLLTDHSVRLELNRNREEKDKYGRYLLYVHRDDGLFYNEYMIQNGYAREYTVGKPYSLQTEFKVLESEAKAANKGLWGKCQ